MTILITGANGQLGREVVAQLQERERPVIAAGREVADFSRPNRVYEFVADCAADWVINCAAYTQVDRAEDERQLAFTVNRDAARALALGVKRSGGRLLHVSTDFVFSGEQSHPYEEGDTAAPLGVYGQSKFEGELAVREVFPEALILRTAWVYGEYGRNFVKTILRLAREKRELKVVDDQIGTPSWTYDIAKAMQALIFSNASGVFHFTNEGVASWYDLAMEVVVSAKRMGMPLVAEIVHPIPSRDFPLKARRPAYSVLSKEKIRKTLNYEIPHWRDSLHIMLKRLIADIPTAETAEHLIL